MPSYHLKGHAVNLMKLSDFYYLWRSLQQGKAQSVGVPMRRWGRTYTTQLTLSMLHSFSDSVDSEDATQIRLTVVH